MATGYHRRLESAISFCLIAVLFLIALGVFLKQFSYDLTQFGLYGVEKADFEMPIQLASFVPARFEPLSSVEVYNAENLYEKIDGKATFYIELGFVRLDTQRFISKQDQNLWMEIFVYDMGILKNAFAVYSQQIRPNPQLLPHLEFAYKTSNALFFVHGKYYVELIGSSSLNELLDAMSATASEIARNLSIDKTTHITEIDLFPQENIIPGSIKLYLSNAFGFEGLTDTFTCQYRLGNRILTAFLSKRPDQQDAYRIAQRYYNFLIDNGGVAKPATNDAIRMIQGRIIDFYGAVEIIFTIGQFIAGIHEAENQQAAEQLAAQLINKLSKAIKQ